MTHLKKPFLYHKKTRLSWGLQPPIQKKTYVFLCKQENGRLELPTVVRTPKKTWLKFPPLSSLTWLAGKSPFSNGKYIFKWWMFYCHVSFRGGGGTKNHRLPDGNPSYFPHFQPLFACTQQQTLNNDTIDGNQKSGCQVTRWGWLFIPLFSIAPSKVRWLAGGHFWLPSTVDGCVFQGTKGPSQQERTSLQPATIYRTASRCIE